MDSSVISERVQVVVIGGGQAGLSVGYCLAQRGLSFVVLEAGARIGDAWRKRWDSLRLHSSFDAAIHSCHYDHRGGSVSFPAIR